MMTQNLQSYNQPLHSQTVVEEAVLAVKNFDHKYQCEGIHFNWNYE